MTELSPQAQAVLDAGEQHAGIIAAAFRSAASQLREMYESEGYVDSPDDWLDDIAAELDGRDNQLTLELANEIEHFISEYGKIRGLDPEDIYKLNVGDPEREASLRVSRLRLIASILRLRCSQPVHVGEWQTGLPPFAGFYYVRGLLNESIGGDNRPVFVNPKNFVWGFWELDDPEWISLAPSEITPENIQWKPVSLMPQPVPVSERPWEQEGWCDDQGRCWWFNPGQPAMSNPHIATSSWRLCQMLNGKPMGSYSLPYNALTLPGEVK